MSDRPEDQPKLDSDCRQDKALSNSQVVSLDDARRRRDEEEERRLERLVIERWTGRDELES